MNTERPDVIPCLKHILKRQYDQGYDSTCDTIEETIVELERLRATVVNLRDENVHLRAVNQRQIEALVERMPLGMRMRMHEGIYFYERLTQTMGDGGQNPSVTPEKPPAL